MRSDPLTVQQIFQDRRQYRVPFYQRPYVWNREDQWERLWDDILVKADVRLQGGKTHPHFMGAVVLEPQDRESIMGVEQLHIIDGQQRLTTLQYLLTGLAHCLRDSNISALLPLVEGCLRNSNPETMKDKSIEPFKLWPTFRDRQQYVWAMTAQSLDELRERFPASFRKDGELRKIGVDHPPALDAVCYYREQISKWLDGEGEQKRVDRANILASVILRDLSVVCIALGADDDAQVIFETLNGHGAELHATDLIRNFIFMRASLDADDLYATLWTQFEESFWAEDQTRGRLKRPRMEWFVQTALQAETGDEVDIGRLYAAYRHFAGAGLSAMPAAKQLHVLDRYAIHYKSLTTGSGEEPIAVFGRRIAPWDASTIHSLALRIATSGVDPVAQRSMYDDIESFFVRRGICGLSTKNYNKVFVQQLRKLVLSGVDASEFHKALSESTGDASRWPGDDEFRRAWLEGNIYPGRLEASRLRAILHRVETGLRSAKSEEGVVLSLDTLDIDHIMPQSWAAYWPLADGQQAIMEDLAEARLFELSGAPVTGKVAAVLERQRSIPRFGNLTMINYGVNRSLQNREFSEKRKAFFSHSNLQLNRELMLREIWDEASIRVRGEALFEVARKIWRSPA